MFSMILYLFNQTTLPFIEYSGFCLLACCIEDDRVELQRIQNDILVICNKSKLKDEIRLIIYIITSNY